MQTICSWSSSSRGQFQAFWFRQFWCGKNILESVSRIFKMKHLNERWKGCKIAKSETLSQNYGNSRWSQCRDASVNNSASSVHRPCQITRRKPNPKRLKKGKSHRLLSSPPAKTFYNSFLTTLGKWLANSQLRSLFELEAFSTRERERESEGEWEREREVQWEWERECDMLVSIHIFVQLLAEGGF